jgi:hypothetical protein
MSDILDIESMYIDMYYNTAENLRKLNWFQKLIIGYDKLKKSNEIIKSNGIKLFNNGKIVDSDSEDD